jgi:predicted NBD/HSP70 family sugar kinase
MSEMAAANSCLRKTVSIDDLPRDVIAKWGQAVKAGDQYACNLQKYIGEHLAKVAATAINCYDPEIVMLAGYVAQQCMDYLINAISSRIQTDVFNNQSRNISVIPARAGELAIILGTATAVLQEMEFAQ